MIAVIQRVKKASVQVEGATVGACDEGLLILLGVSSQDSKEDAEVLSRKIAYLRIFTDENDKMNLSLKDIGGGALVISNFTLLANYKKGNRPDYLGAGAPDMAQGLYDCFCELFSKEVVRVEKGIFGAHMEIGMLGNGPVTIVLDSRVLLNKNV